MEEEPAPLPECHEGPSAFERFDATMSALLTVPKSLILAQHAATVLTDIWKSSTRLWPSLRRGRRSEIRSEN